MRERGEGDDCTGETVKWAVRSDGSLVIVPKNVIGAGEPADRLGRVRCSGGEVLMVKAYDHAIASVLAAGDLDHAEEVERALHLSWVFLREVPRRPDVELLDPERMIALLLRELSMLVEWAREQTDRWTSLAKAEILRLHEAKGLLRAGLHLAYLLCGDRLPEPLRSWEELFPSLP